MRKYPLAIIAMLLFFSLRPLAAANIQEIKPQINKRCPDFTLHEVTHYRKNTVSLSDFKGKWLFMEFWFTGCSACIRRLPKINDLQKSFDRNKVQFLLVGYKDSGYNSNIREVFEKLRKKQGLDLVSAYDSALAKRWGIHSMPHILVIDPTGIVRYITDGVDMTSEKIQTLIDGNSVKFSEKGKQRQEFNPFQHVVRDNMRYHSVLTKYNGEAFHPGYELDRFVRIKAKESGYQLTAVNLFSIFNIAYFGKSYFKIMSDTLYGRISQHPTLDVTDTSAFIYDYPKLKGLYNYSLYIPPSRISKEAIMKYMQDDLERAFGFSATVQMRDMPAWKLVASPGAEEKLRTRGGPSYNSSSEKSSAAGFEMTNVSIKEFMRVLCYYVNEKEDRIFVDGTGISKNLDVTIEADLTDLSDIKRALREIGLNLVKSTKKMQVLVITDQK